MFGVVLKKFGFTDLERNVAVVAWNTILFGLLMLWPTRSDRRSRPSPM